MKTIQYKDNEAIIVTWTPSKCAHAGICVKMLPNVYHPNVRPWITPKNASRAALIEQIDKCPTGALGYILK